MDIEVCRVKISHLTVTASELDYIEGSLTLDGNLLQRSGLYPHEKVLVINLQSGERFETYLIEGEPGSGTVCLNGGTARRGEVGDRLIVLSFARVSPPEAEGHEPDIFKADDENTLTRIK